MNKNVHRYQLLANFYRSPTGEIRSARHTPGCSNLKENRRRRRREGLNHSFLPPAELLVAYSGIHTRTFRGKGRRPS
uniref:Uncharacterized protein n=1 Tax=Aegilops tauschii subsp. strangulata TaxID=200361 RepID=A0A453R490_AEGTS